MGLEERKRMPYPHLLHQDHAEGVPLAVRNHLVYPHVLEVLGVDGVEADRAAPPVLLAKGEVVEDAGVAKHVPAPGDARGHGVAEADGAVLVPGERYHDLLDVVPVDVEVRVCQVGDVLLRVRHQEAEAGVQVALLVVGGDANPALRGGGHPTLPLHKGEVQEMVEGPPLLGGRSLIPCTWWRRWLLHYFSEENPRGQKEGETKRETKLESQPESQASWAILEGPSPQTGVSGHRQCQSVWLGRRDSLADCLFRERKEMEGKKGEKSEERVKKDFGDFKLPL